MADEVDVLETKDITSEEFYSEWVKAVRIDLADTVGRELTPEEWVKFVRYEVNSCLDKFFPIMKTGNVGVKYSHAIANELETGPEYDPNKANGVTINLVFEFDTDIDIPKEE